MENGCPVMLDLTGRLCVIIGGGRGAAVKARTLSRAGARLRIVAECVSEELENNDAEIIKRKYKAGDIDGAFLVFPLTGDPETDACVRADARAGGTLIGGEDFILPAAVTGGNMTAFVSTGYPKLSAKLMRGLMRYDYICGMLRDFRQRIKTGAADERAREAALEAAVTDEALEAALRSSVEYEMYLDRLERQFSDK